MKTQIRRHLLTLVVSLSLIASGQSARQSKERAVSIPSDAATRIGQLQKIDAQKSMIKGLYRQLTKARAEKPLQIVRDDAFAERAMLFGKPTRFRKAAAPPVRYVSSRSTPPMHSLVSNVAVNGMAQDSISVGDPFTLSFSFASDMISANIRIYIDLDLDGVVGGDDFLLLNFHVFDNDDGDEDPTAGRAAITFRESDVVSHIAAAFLIVVDDFYSQSSTSLKVVQEPTPSIVRGSVSPAGRFLLYAIDLQTNVLYVFGDSVGSCAFYVDRSQTSALELRTYDLFGVMNGYLPPSTQTVQLISDTTDVRVAYTEATSFIEGYALDQLGTPVPSVTIEVYPSQEYSSFVRTETSLDGHYRVGVGAGIWRLYHDVPDNGEYMGSWDYDDTVHVPSQMTVQRDLLIIKANTSISGSVRMDGRGVGGVVVQASNDSLYNTVLTSGDGTYVLPVYKHASDVSPYNVSTYVSRGYVINDGYRPNIPAGATGVDFVMSKVNGGLQGRISDFSTGEGVPHAYIYASGPDYAGTYSNDSGYYRMSLFDGNYYVYASADKYYSLSEYVVIAGSVITKNFALRRWGSFSGTITDSSGNAVSSAAIVAVDSSGTYSVAGGYARNDGTYTVGGIGTGYYKAYSYANGYVNQWFDKAETSGDATAFNVSDGFDTPGINFVLLRGGGISGTVTDKAGNPISQVSITVFDTLYNAVSYAETDSAGCYTAFGLRSGEYLVHAYDLVHVDQWYDGVNSSYSATRVKVAVHHTTPEVDFVLVMGGSITGTVRNTTGSGISGSLVVVYTLKWPFTIMWAGYDYTDGFGHYSVNRLQAHDSLIVCASGNGTDGYGTRWYDDAPYLDSATPIVLEEGEVRAIDFVLRRMGIVSGSVKDNHGRPLSAMIVVEDTLGNAVQTVYSYGDLGNYSATYIEEGTYRMSASCSGYETQWYNRKTFRETADRLVIGEGSQLSNIDFVLSGLGPLLTAFIDRVEAAPYPDRPALVDSFLNAVPSFPFIEQDTIVHFLYRGVGTNVTIPGDVNSWDPYSSTMTRISSTDLWYRTEVHPDDARLEYKFLIDYTQWIADPNNGYHFGEYANSELRMPAYEPPPEIEYYADIPHGALRDTTIHSSILSNTRTIRIYTPPSYSSSGSENFPLVVFHDGLAYLSTGKANNVLDYLIHRARIKPVIGVFVPPVNRDAEYWDYQQTQFASFICNELVPVIDAKYRTLTSPNDRATVGISAGSVVALHIAYHHPDVFGKVAAHSGANVENIASYRDGPYQPIQIYGDAGTYEFYSLDMRELRTALESKGYTHSYKEWHEGHSWGNWRAHLDNALEYLFPGLALSVNNQSKSIPEAFRLEQNYPNPFNPSTSIPYELPEASFVTLKIYDMLGREIAVLVQQEFDAGFHKATWNATGVASGVYICVLQAQALASTSAKPFIETKKLMLLR
ncbi:MAG TPA: hypothetical protein DCX46_06020 [Bacteroidetes bacterium]|nr:hypothetical protein [Bacteroidota bacterium]